MDYHYQTCMDITNTGFYNHGVTIGYHCCHATALTPVDIAPAIVENSKEGVSTHVVNHAGESNADNAGNEPKKGDWV